MTDKARTRVLHVVGSLELGGGQKLTALVAAGLDRRRFDVTVVNLGRPGPYGDYLAEHGIPVIDLGLPMRLTPSGLLPSIRGICRLLRILFNHPRWDIVHTHLFRTSMLCAIPSRLAGARLFGTVHRIYYGWQPPIERLLAPLHEALVVDSAAVGHILQARTGIPVDKYAVIHDGIDQREYVDAPSREVAMAALHIPVSATVITEIASLAPHKGQEHLLAAFARLQDADVRLLLVGDGPDRGRLERLAVELRVMDRTTFLAARPDLPTLLRATDILALPSTFEGFGIVMAEAMYLGIAVVGTNHGGATEVVVDAQTGYLVPFGDVEALADRLSRLVMSPGLRAEMGRAGHSRVIERFTQHVMAARYADLYEGRLMSGMRLDEARGSPKDPSSGDD